MKTQPLICVLLMALLGCGEAPVGETGAEVGLALTKLRIRDATPADLRPVTIASSDLEGALRLALALEGMTPTATPARWLLGPVGPQSGWSLSISARAVYGVATRDGLADVVTPGEAKAVWTAEARIRAPGQRTAVTYSIEAEAGHPFSGDARALGKALGRHLGTAALVLAERLANRLVMLSKTAPELISLVGDDLPETRFAAVEQLAQLRAVDAVPALAQRLRDEPEFSIKLRVIGALAEIGDPRAADALISAADPKNRELLGACVDALSVVGGQRVDDFLEILASHDAPDIREMVEAARARRGRLGGQP